MFGHPTQQHEWCLQLQRLSDKRKINLDLEKLQNFINEIQSKVIFIVQTEYHHFDKEIPLIKEKFMKADYRC